MKDIKQKDRVRGSLIGGAIGDALGCPVEFIFTYEDIKRQYGENGITKFDATESLISDDTQMTLFTALGLLNAKEQNIAPIDAIRNAYIEWLYTQKGFRHKQYSNCWIGDLPELNVCRAPGNTCITALEHIVQGKDPMNSSKGCGGVMRIAPVPLYGLSQNRIEDVSALNELAADAAELTHKHPLGYIPAYVMSHIIYCLGTDENPTLEAFRKYVCEAMRMAENKYADKSLSVQTIRTLVDLALELSCKDLPENECVYQIGEGWVAEETLAIAIYCCAKHFDNFEKAIIASVNHGGDSDSTGAVTGNIMGAAIGYEAIPQHLKADLQLHDVILHVADDLWRGYITR